MYLNKLTSSLETAYSKLFSSAINPQNDKTVPKDARLAKYGLKKANPRWWHIGTLPHKQIIDCRPF